jgi:hypothetical protein
MNSTGIRPDPAPCKEPVPLAFKPRVDATWRSISVLVEPLSRTKDSGFDPLMRTGTKIIPLRQSKEKVVALPSLVKATLLMISDD